MRKALVIGLHNYPHASLLGCIGDAKEIYRILKEHEDQTVNFGCKILIDEKGQVNRQQIKNQIIELFEAEKYEAVLLYFAGHGNIDAAGGYILASDEYKEGVSMAEILTLANQSKANNKIIILDCCHAGAIVNPPNGDVTGIGDGVTILTACTKNQTAGQEKGRGVFTRLLIEALEGGAADLCGNVTAGSVYGFIDNALGQWGQRPVFKTNVNSFMSIRKVKPPIPLEVLKKIILYFKEVDLEYRLDPSYEFTAPEANPDHVAILKDLQKMVSVGVVKPVGEEHMYFAAMNSKSCKLTVLGQCYWRYINSDEI
ncbi:MAG TPA: peptidase C14 [Firmicutes bacterium]|jgi:hypothetical protein|nr:peptidase C14 [Bacillota bacterium]